LAGDEPQKLATSTELHAHLHRCNSCGTYWEQGERFPSEISEDEAKRDFPEAFAALQP
jgi:hypothetical protein